MRETLAGGGTSDAKIAHDIVLQLMDGLHGKAHVVFTDNYFTSIPLLLELLAQGTYGVGTVQSNRIGLPKCFQDMNSLSKDPQGTLLWRMHRSAQISCVVFVDRKVVKFLSTFYPLVLAVNEAWPTVPRLINSEVTDLVTSLVHKGYFDIMRGVDVANYLRDSYSCQTKSHK